MRTHGKKKRERQRERAAPVCRVHASVCSAEEEEARHRERHVSDVKGPERNRRTLLSVSSLASLLRSHPSPLLASPVAPQDVQPTAREKTPDETSCHDLQRRKREKRRQRRRTDANETPDSCSSPRRDVLSKERSRLPKAKEGRKKNRKEETRLEKQAQTKACRVIHKWNRRKRTKETRQIRNN